MVLLQPALCSTAYGGGLSCGGPSIPLPQPCSVEPNTARPGLVGLWQVGGNDLSAKPPTPLAAVRRCPTEHGDVKRGPRSRVGRSAAKP